MGIELSSERFFYRRMDATDLNNFLRLIRQAEVMKYITGQPLSDENGRESFKKILNIIEANPQCGYFAVHQKTDHSFTGYVKLVLKEKGKAELGYMFLPEFWGKGLGSEVIRRMLDFSHTVPEIKTVVAVTDPENLASKRILMKNGFQLHETCQMEGLPAEIYQLEIKLK